MACDAEQLNWRNLEEEIESLGFERTMPLSRAAASNRVAMVSMIVSHKIANGRSRDAIPCGRPYQA